MKENKERKSILLGLGLDNDDGHKRITRSEHFCIAGGSEETHDRLTETAIKTMEFLGSRGRTLQDVEAHELREILEKHSPET